MRTFWGRGSRLNHENLPIPREYATKLWSIDASFTVHNDTRSHTGAMLPFRREVVVSLTTNKQKVNSTSSTVAEIIGVDDAINFVI